MLNNKLAFNMFQIYVKDERLRKEKSQSGKGTAKSPGLDDFGKRSFTSRDQENMPPANSRNKEELSNTPFSKGKSNGLALSKDDSIRGKLPSYDDSFTRKNSSYDDSNQRGLSSSVSQGNLSNRLGKGTPLLSPLKPLSLEGLFHNIAINFIHKPYLNVVYHNN